MKAKIVAAAAALFLLSGSAFAQALGQTVQSNGFAVSVTFSPICTVKTQPGATTLDFGTYTPFTNVAVQKTTNVVFQCSQGIVPQSVVLATAATGAGEATVSAAGATASAVGVLKGLRYTLATTDVTAAAAKTAGTAATAGTAGTGGSNSTANEYAVTITADMAGGQAGATTGSSSHTYTITMAY